MAKIIASVVFDRKKKVEKTGLGEVEIRIYLGQGVRKYVSVRKCSELEWEKYQKNKALLAQVKIYNEIAASMAKLGEEMTIENFELHAGIKSVKKKKEEAVVAVEADGFINFMKAAIKKEDLAPGTVKRKKVVVDACIAYGRLSRFIDITEKNIKDFDEWLHDGTREDVSVYTYHKVLKQYTRLAFEEKMIPENPYDHCHFSRGKCKERKPLNETELKKLRKMKLNESLGRVRDLFIFCAYTGLAYVDSQTFDFKSMCEKQDGTYYIDGSRVKTGSNFYTPILPPAMEVLKKYNFEIPKISNQKANLYLHTIEERGEFRKKMTTHVARHSFATLLLSHDVTIENVARMMGHQDVKTTQIYAKVLNSTIQKRTQKLISSLK